MKNTHSHAYVHLHAQNNIFPDRLPYVTIHSQTFVDCETLGRLLSDPSHLQSEYNSS